MANRKDMEYVTLGKSGLKISKLILGTMGYGKTKWCQWGLSEEEGMEHIKAAYDVGINAFDTANGYGDGQSEIILGKAIKKYNLPREEIVIMTKFSGVVIKNPEHNTVLEYWYNHDKANQDGYVNQYGASRKHIFAAVQDSLKRLQLDYIDVYQLHRIDPNTPFEETMQALHDVVQKGWVRYIGISACYAWQFHQLQNYAITNRLTPFVSMQNLYNLLYREEEREMFPTLNLFGVGSIPYSTLANGYLSRPLNGEQTTRSSVELARSDRWLQFESNRTIVDRVEELAEKKGCSMAQLAMAWACRKPGVTAPIIGVSSIEKLHDLLGALKITLTPEEVKYLEEPYKIQSIIGYR
ncbi:NADP-dependent oxidoreductase domain-containing protein [Mycena floridula]|nr:NADP-dependent oxidoreductase domain-containing protein [Mycena floridula]